MKLVSIFIKFLENARISKFLLFFVVLCFLSLFLVFSFQPDNDLVLGHDFVFHSLRIQALIKAIQEGNFPLYLDFEAVNGYGYPTKWFYPDVFLIPFALLAITTNTVFAYKILLFIISVLCGIFMYITIKKVYKFSYIATVGSLLYTFSFYRIQDLFERAALAEALSFTFVPLAFLGLYNIIKGNYKKWYILSLGITCLIFTHVLSMLLTVITLAIFTLFYIKPLWKEKKRIYYLFLSAIVTIFLSAYFLFPLIEQIQSNIFYYEIEPIYYIKYYTKSILFILWGFSFVNIFPNQDGNIFFVAMGILMGISICLRLFIWNKSKFNKSVDIGLLIGIFYVFASWNIFPWDWFPFNKLNIIRFPYRLYEFASYFFSIGGAYYSYQLFKSKKNRFVIILFVIGSTIFIIYGESKVYKAKFSKYNPHNINYNYTNFYGQGALEYIPAKVPYIKYIDERGDSIKTKYKETIISNFTRNKGVVTVEVNPNGKKESVEFPLFYYNGYTAKLNGEKKPIQESKNGFLEINDISQQGKVEVIFSGTIIQRISPYITIISLLILCIYIVRTRKKIDKY